MFKYIFQIIFLLLSLSGSAQAQSELYHNIEPIKLNTVVRGHGVVNISLTKIRLLLPGSNSIFYQGVLSTRHGNYPVAADRLGNTLRVVFPGKVTGSRKSRQRTFRLKFQDDNLVQTSSVPSSFARGKRCDTEHGSNSTIVTALSEPSNLETTKVLTISTFFDLEWESLYGTQSNHEIATVINTSEALYEQQLGIRFRIVSQAKLATRPANSNPGTILNSFRLSGEQAVEADAYHLFTGIDMDGSTIGIAYVGAICYAPTYSFGVTQSFGILTSNVFAHELGHNLGAQHDVTSPGSLMYPSISWGTPYFSAKSISDISGFLSYFGTCLEDEQLPPTVHGAKITIKRNKKQVVVTLISRKGVALVGKNVSITIGKAVRTKVTNGNGKATVGIPKTKNKRIRVTATLVEDPTITRTVVIKL
jgi:hypothetical protein